MAKDVNYKSVKWIVESTALCKKYGYNLLINIGPHINTEVPLMQKAMLDELGKWVQMCGERFYEGRPSKVEGTGDDFALTTLDDNDYAYLFGVTTWGDANVLKAKESGHKVYTNVTQEISKVSWMDNGKEVPFTQYLTHGILVIHPSHFEYGNNWIVRVAKIEYVQSTITV